jgi:hypothetical protein
VNDEQQLLRDNQGAAFREAYLRERSERRSKRRERGGITRGSLFEAVRRALRRPVSADPAPKPPGGR